MDAEKIREIARNMIARHGLRAQAVAQEHLEEVRRQGETANLEHWQAVFDAVVELRRTEKAA
jgi:hypothetical protein